ncbi:MATE family efflux transporter [Aerococcus sp. UMB1112A]|uniref:MATE family efflux transporter n=1 Tax=Aerococcus sp. UMB1112A TaxID=3050609 RepID=UPI00254AE4D7|nr:MATE family efflux transporter [Aerococcus sp. UMB1112A]MDK8502360.1 MATE family efflux transporter [Aerococcus sp. UMB1112A]
MLFKTDIKQAKIKKFKNLFLPILIEQVFMMLIMNVNVFLISLVNDRAIALTGLTDQIIAIGQLLLGIVSLGSTILFLQNADKVHLDYIRKIFQQSLLLNGLLSLLITLVFVIFGSNLLQLINSPANLIETGNIYLQLLGWSLLPLGISSSVNALLRSYGKVRAAMYASILNTLIVVSGNAFVVYTHLLDNAVIGIGIATLIMRCLGVFISLLILKKDLPKIFELKWSFHLEDLKISSKILRLGVPSAMENVFYNISQLLITAGIASLGVVSLSSRIYTQTITAIIFTISVAAGQSSQILIGKAIRKEDMDQGTATGRSIVKAFFSLSVILNVIIALLGPLLIQIFTEDEVIKQVVTILLWLSILYDPFRASNEILIANLNVVGDVRYPVIVGVLTTYLFTVPVSLSLIYFFNQGLIAVWFVFIVDEALRAVIFYRRWTQKKWLLSGNLS